jgi:hypothetical protein
VRRDRPSDAERGEPTGDTKRSSGQLARDRGDDAPAKNERPRTDTIALVEANASKSREVPTWLAVIAIVALSLTAGMATYLVRLKTTSDTQPATTASADGRATTTSGFVRDGKGETASGALRQSSKTR